MTAIAEGVEPQDELDSLTEAGVLCAQGFLFARPSAPGSFEAVILQTSGLKGGISIDHAHPRWVDRVAHDFPGLRLICAHGCVPYFRELALVTRRRPNVYASPDLYTFLDFSACQWIQPGQLIFASGYPFVPVERVKKTYLSAPWAGSHKLDDIMYRNAIRALKLEHNALFASRLKQPPVFSRNNRNA